MGVWRRCDARTGWDGVGWDGTEDVPLPAVVGDRDYRQCDGDVFASRVRFFFLDMVAHRHRHDHQITINANKFS